VVTTGAWDSHLHQRAPIAGSSHGPSNDGVLPRQDPGRSEQPVECVAIQKPSIRHDGADSTDVPNVFERIAVEQHEIRVAASADRPELPPCPKTSAGLDVPDRRAASAATPDSVRRASSSCRSNPGATNGLPTSVPASTPDARARRLRRQRSVHLQQPAPDREILRRRLGVGQDCVRRWRSARGLSQFRNVASYLFSRRSPGRNWTGQSLYLFCSSYSGFDWISKNPERAVKAPRVKEKPTLPFSKSEMQRILEGCDRYRGDQDRLRAFVLVMRHSGMRIGDTVSLDEKRLKRNTLLLCTAKTGTPITTGC
jgi:hypothetical protein